MYGDWESPRGALGQKQSECEIVFQMGLLDPVLTLPRIRQVGTMEGSLEPLFELVTWSKGYVGPLSGRHRVHKRQEKKR